MDTDEADTTAAYLATLLEAKHLSATSTGRMADLTPMRGTAIFSGERQPSRNEVLRIALAAALGKDAANELLTLSGNNPLDESGRRDQILAQCLEQGFSPQKTRERLQELGLSDIS